MNHYGIETLSIIGLGVSKYECSNCAKHFLVDNNEFDTFGIPNHCPYCGIEWSETFDNYDHKD